MTLSEMWIIPTFKPHFHFHTWREWRNKDQCYLCYYFNARKGSKMRVHHAPETVLFPNENVVTKCLQHSHKIVLSNDNHGLKTGTAHFEGAVCSDKCIGRVLSDITKLGSTEYDASH